MESDLRGTEYYRRVLHLLGEASMEFLVGGAYGFAHYTGIHRDTKDFDIFLRRRDVPQALEALNGAGFPASVLFPHWLAKSYCGEFYVDFIYSSGNGVAAVDDGWFEHAVNAEILGIATRLCPVEETIWSKSFVMERERYDGADVAHLLRCCGRQLDWQRLLERFDEHWPVLLSNLVLFDFIYPDQQDVIPPWVRKHLSALWQHQAARPDGSRICGGTLLSREQYLPDLERWNYLDARQQPLGPMRPQDIELWTRG